MFDFDSAMKDSLGLARERFNAADKDVRDYFEKLENALTKASAEALTLELQTERRWNGIVYRLFLEHRGRDRYMTPMRFTPSVADLYVSSKGYPVETGRFNPDIDKFEPEQTIETRSALEAWFAGLAAHSDSPLIKRAVTLLASGDADDEEDLDFEKYVTTSDDEEDDSSITEDNIPF